MKHLSILIALCGFSVLIGCRGEPSRLPPVHLNQNMDLQDKYKPQRVSKIFKDGRAMRPTAEGTVGRDILSAYGVQKAGLASYDDRYLREDDAYWRGIGSNGKPVEIIPESVKLDMDVMKRGQERYGIYCTPCHGPTGYGDGLVRTVGKINVPSYHDQYKRELTAGHIYGVISNGSASGLMKGYKHQISVEDRWAIVAYVRALQRSQYGSEADVPPKPKTQDSKKEAL